LSVALSSVLGTIHAAPPPASGDSFVYFGTYTGFRYQKSGAVLGKSKSKGIYVARFHHATGELDEVQLAAEIRNPSFIVAHPNGRFLYSVVEDPLSLGPLNDKASYVSAFSIDRKTGKLKLLNTVPSGGTSTCHIALDRSGKYVMVASFGSGSATVIRLNPDGSLGAQTALVKHTGHGANPVFQTGPRAHTIATSADNRFVVVADFGIDKLMVYKFDAAAGSLTPNDPPSVNVDPGGSGPRRFIFDPGGKFGYVVSEMNGVVNVFSWEAQKGVLTAIQAMPTMPAHFNDDPNAASLNPFHSAEMMIHPNGKFLYASNRGPDTIVVLSVDPGKGTLKPVQEVSSRGLMPRSFGIDPSGDFLLAAGEVSDDVVVFHLDSATGRIIPTRGAARVETPVCIVFVPVE
jgi:6-phosphogluconolactonase